MHVKRTNNYSSSIIMYVTLIVTKPLLNCDNILCFLEDYGVLVCKEQHHNVPSATRKQIVERFSARHAASSLSTRTQCAYIAIKITSKHG
jgi:hypothetical protein